MWAASRATACGTPGEVARREMTGVETSRLDAGGSEPVLVMAPEPVQFWTPPNLFEQGRRAGFAVGLRGGSGAGPRFGCRPNARAPAAVCELT